MTKDLQTTSGKPDHECVQDQGEWVNGSPSPSAETVEGEGADPSLQAGFELDVVHEEAAAFIVIRIRLPRNGALSWLIRGLTQNDRGLNRMGGL